MVSPRETRDHAGRCGPQVRNVVHGRAVLKALLLTLGFAVGLLLGKVTLGADLGRSVIAHDAHGFKVTHVVSAELLPDGTLRFVTDEVFRDGFGG